MDKFLTFPGQQPIYLGDIDFMQTAVGNALKNLLISYTGNADGSAILAGVELPIDGADISWTEGVVAIEGDILPVAAGTITGGASSTLYFNVVATLSGSRTMKDGTVRQCWQTKTAAVTTEVTDYPVLDFGRAGLAQKAMVYNSAAPGSLLYDAQALPNTRAPAYLLVYLGIYRMKSSRNLRQAGSIFPSRYFRMGTILLLSRQQWG